MIIDIFITITITSITISITISFIVTITITITITIITITIIWLERRVGSKALRVRVRSAQWAYWHRGQDLWLETGRMLQRLA